jgi:hypothetical protein
MESINTFSSDDVDGFLFFLMSPHREPHQDIDILEGVPYL